MSDSNINNMTSNKPYLVGAFYDWISDNDLTPYIVVDVNVYGVLVPMNYVADGQIVLNIASSAVGAISMGETAIEFSARFGGKLEHMTVPYGAIAAIYAKENGAGTSLPIEHPSDEEIDEETLTSEPAPEKSKTTLSSVTSDSDDRDKSALPKVKSKASLKVIK
ncbi:ClpXP protease specificity-enhancing factor [Colwellia sp. D2M02]|uniref:ClpXP protease specificity-enhancing factor n=1 Tax=Colwellia asteriadis TaxID=517723 RepID=A0ABN1L5C1_9GAMM|nr:ClpXP protease specificity-enhancing factor [Colwellia sp. D2M02]MBU2894813.1 ClpXP protease specificity-enhancing factor [Colwellia sp. D2M02]